MDTDIPNMEIAIDEKLIIPITIQYDFQSGLYFARTIFILKTVRGNCIFARSGGCETMENALNSLSRKVINEIERKKI